MRTKSATQAFLVSSRNAPPWWGGALHDDTENACVADYMWALELANFRDHCSHSGSRLHDSLTCG